MKLVRITLILLSSVVLLQPIFARVGGCDSSGRSCKDHNQTNHASKNPHAASSQNDSYSSLAKTSTMCALKHDPLMTQSPQPKTGVIAEDDEFRDPRGALLDEEHALSQQRHLVGAGGQVCDLFAARDLHIIDVYDQDGRGTKQRAFARIFYAEGRLLVFYAYDLADPRKMDQPVSFYAWGEWLGGGQPVKRLGIFHSEDISKGLWTLTFDDPGVLAQINSVFVTVEEEKVITRPNGKKILFAFLGNKANHP